MSTIGMILSVVMAIVGVLIIVAVMLQSNRNAGLGVMGGASSSNDSYWSKNKGNSIEGSLAKYTKLLGVAFIVIGNLVNYIG